MKHMKKGAILMGLLALLGCGPSLEKHAERGPKFDLQDYFNGDIKGWGLIQDLTGNVVSQFDVDIKGTWQGDTGTLDETFTYYTGTKDTRLWTITKQEDGTYIGGADDIIGGATGSTSGNAVRWKYKMKIPVGGSEYTMTLDDWMWQMNDGVLINRSYIKKFGFTVAELTLVMQKQ